MKVVANLSKKPCFLSETISFEGDNVCETSKNEASELKNPSIEWAFVINHQKARAMKKEKSLWSIMTKETGWSNLSIKQKLLVAWFSLSLCSVLIFAESLVLSAVSVVSLVFSAYFMKKRVKIED